MRMGEHLCVLEVRVHGRRKERVKERERGWRDRSMCDKQFGYTIDVQI